MVGESRHLSVRIDRPVDEVYEYDSNPANLAEWAAGLGQGIEQVDGQWVMDSPAGRHVLSFTPRNPFGVLDHQVRTPDGDTVQVPVRVIADGRGSEIIFTLRRRPEMSDQDWEQDATAVSADLATLKQLLERG